jgi:hypothetical protein
VQRHLDVYLKECFLLNLSGYENTNAKYFKADAAPRHVLGEFVPEGNEFGTVLHDCDSLGGLASCDLMADEDINVVGPGHRCAFDQVRDELVYPRIFFVCVTLGILLTFPKAQGKDLVGLGIRHKQNLVHESWLVFKDWEDLIVNSFGELLRFSRFGPDRNDSGEHSIPPVEFIGSGGVRHNICPIGSRVNYRKMVHGASRLGCAETQTFRNSVLRCTPL